MPVGRMQSLHMRRMFLTFQDRHRLVMALRLKAMSPAVASARLYPSKRDRVSDVQPVRKRP